MKNKIDYEVNCYVTDGRPYWFGYKLQPGFVYDNKFYNVIWAKYLDSGIDLTNINDMIIQLEVTDINNDIHVQFEPKNIKVKDIKDESLKDMLRDLVKEAYGEYILEGDYYGEY